MPPFWAQVAAISVKKSAMLAQLLTRGQHSGVQTLRKFTTLENTFIIYLGTCSRCKGQYIGKSTQPFKRRHSGHKQEIKNRIGGLGHHYGGDGGCSYQHLTVQVIDQVDQGDHQALSDQELFWQHQLRCYVENGANGHCYKKEFS